MLWVKLWGVENEGSRIENPNFLTAGCKFIRLVGVRVIVTWGIT